MHNYITTSGRDNVLITVYCKWLLGVQLSWHNDDRVPTPLPAVSPSLKPSRFVGHSYHLLHHSREYTCTANDKWLSNFKMTVKLKMQMWAILWGCICLMPIAYTVYEIIIDVLCIFVGCNFHHDDVIKWKHFPRYWPFVRAIQRSPVNPRTKTSDAEL